MACAGDQCHVDWAAASCDIVQLPWHSKYLEMIPSLKENIATYELCGANVQNEIIWQHVKTSCCGCEVHDSLHDEPEPGPDLGPGRALQDPPIVATLHPGQLSSTAECQQWRAAVQELAGFLKKRLEFETCSTDMTCRLHNSALIRYY